MSVVKTIAVIMLLALITLFASVIGVFAQQATTATTEGGRKILLYPDGTWRLLKTPVSEPSKDFRHTRMQRMIVHLVELVDVLSKARLRDDHWKAHRRYKGVAANPAA
jgi:hypothetical protein